MSFIYDINRKGPRTYPCGNPLSTSHQLELLSPINTLCFLPIKKDTDTVDQPATKTIGSELMDKFKIRNFIEYKRKERPAFCVYVVHLVHLL